MASDIERVVREKDAEILRLKREVNDLAYHLTTLVEVEEEAYSRRVEWQPDVLIQARRFIEHKKLVTRDERIAKLTSMAHPWHLIT